MRSHCDGRYDAIIDGTSYIFFNLLRIIRLLEMSVYHPSHSEIIGWFRILMVKIVKGVLPAVCLLVLGA